TLMLHLNLLIGNLSHILQKNSTWKLDNISGVEPARFKAQLVVKGFKQGEGIDFNEQLDFSNGSSVHLLLYVDDMLIASHENKEESWDGNSHNKYNIISYARQGALQHDNIRKCDQLHLEFYNKLNQI
ncbi:hypothetical protein ACJX0J_008377, partial [Zea mays]